MTSYRQTWNLFPTGSTYEGSDQREVILPHSLKTTVRLESRVETRFLSPQLKYTIINGKKENVSGIKAKAMQLQLKRLYTPLILKQKATELKLEDYATHHALVLESKEDKVVYFVNKKNYAITQVTGFIHVHGQTITFDTLYTIFKKFDGVLMPTKEYKSANNVRTAILTLQSVDFTHNVNISEDKKYELAYFKTNAQ